MIHVTKAEGVGVEPRPFVKMVGGKTALLPELLTRIPPTFGTYFEVLVGGGALFWALVRAGRIRSAARLSDANDLLMNVYRVVRDDVEGLIEVLSEMPYDHDFYYDIRTQEPSTSIERAAWYLYLNKSGYNGLMRFNRRGGFNTPFGTYKNPTICNALLLRACSRSLQATELETALFETVLQHAHEGDLAYMDPPYLPVSKTANFTSYTSDGFKFADQERIRDVALELKERGVHILLSNSDHPRVRELYADRRFIVDEVQAPRAINSRSDRRGPVTELLIR